MMKYTVPVELSQRIIEYPEIPYSYVSDSYPMFMPDVRNLTTVNNNHMRNFVHTIITSNTT
eukprot:6174528-Ditylum_brightwellii.AAC.1